jgi:hypothetical protein
MGPRRAGWIRGRLPIGALVLALGAAPARALADGYVNADYSGTWDEAYVEPSNPASNTQSMHFVWDELETAHVFGGTSGGVATVTVLSRKLTVTGTISQQYGPVNAQYNCSGTFSLRPKGQFPLSVLAGTTSNPSIEVSAIVPLRGIYSQTTAGGLRTYPVNGEAGISSGLLRTNNFTTALTPLFTFNLNRRSYRRTFKTLDLAVGGNAQTAVNAVFRAATNATHPPNLPPPPPLPTPVRDQIKRNALRALRQSVVQALYPCGVGVGVGATILGAGPVGLAAGAALLATGTPLCQAVVKQIIAEEKSYKDPPRPDYLVVAQVGAASRLALRAMTCSRFSGARGALCTRVGAAAAGLLSAVRHAEVIAVAIEATIGRDTAAAAAYNQAAVNLQEQTLQTLATQFSAARRTQSNAGSALAAALRTGPVTVRVSVAQFKRDEQALLTAVGHRGVSAATLHALASAALHPRRLDPIAVF